MFLGAHSAYAIVRLQWILDTGINTYDPLILASGCWESIHGVSELDDSAMLGRGLRRAQLSETEVDECHSDDGEDEGPEQASSAAVVQRKSERRKSILPCYDNCAREANHSHELEASFESWSKTERVHVSYVVHSSPFLRSTAIKLEITDLVVDGLKLDIVRVLRLER